MNNREIEEFHNQMKNSMEKEFGIKNEFKVVAIGYLDITEPQYEVGEVPGGFLEKLRQVYHSGSILASMGYHECEFCINQGVKKLPRDALSSCEKSIRDEKNKIDYMFPEMIFHYIKVHLFKPPEEFINFIMNKM